MTDTNANVLLIMGAADFRHAMRQAVARSGWSAAEAARGDIGLELAKQLHPAVIVLDVALPDISGAEVLDQLKRDILTMDIPVVVISSAETATHVSPELVAGNLPRQTAPEQVINVIREAINRSSRS